VADEVFSPWAFSLTGNLTLFGNEISPRPSRHPPASACRLRPLREQLRPHLRNGKAGLRRIGRLLGRELIMKRARVKALDEGREHGVELVLRCLGVEVHLCEAVDPNLGRLR
jgi:hypothetical protein